LDPVKKKKVTEGFSRADKKKKRDDEDKDSNMASEVGGPGNRSIQER
jgi:hypothetical protein